MSFYSLLLFFLMSETLLSLQDYVCILGIRAPCLQVSFSLEDIDEPYSTPKTQNNVVPSDPDSHVKKILYE